MDNFKPKESSPDGDVYEHPSYGCIHISRTQSSGKQSLFGSSIKHSTLIKLEISTAELCRTLNQDWIHSRKPIIEIIMSPTQFADAITSLNQGTIPVTIRWREGKGQIEEPPYQSKVEQFNNEFEDDIKKVGDALDNVINLAYETKAQKRLIEALKLARQQINSNMPFVNEQFSRQMANTVKEAKGEVEGFVNNLIQQHGLESLRQLAPQLESGDNTKGGE
jgi:hypothetical protein